MDKGSVEYWMCEAFRHLDHIPFFRRSLRAAKTIALVAEMLYVAGKFDEFERLLETTPEALAHILGISFSNAPDRLALAQAAARSIAARMKCERALDLLNC